MILNPDNLRHVGQWLAKLRRATSAGQEPVSKEQLADDTGWLAKDFPLSAFTDASVKSVAEVSQFFPKWAVLRGALTDYQDKHPEVPRIPSQISAEVQRQVRELSDEGAWSTRVAEERAQAVADWSDPAKVRASADNIGDHPMRERLGRMLGALVARHAPQNLALLPPQWQRPDR